MRIFPPRFTIRSLMIAVAVFAAGSYVLARYHELAEDQDYFAGWLEAERELWKGEATIHATGGLTRGVVSSIDPRTGLPIVRVTGCVIEDRDRARIRGHNDHIQQYIAWHGLPANSLKP